MSSSSKTYSKSHKLILNNRREFTLMFNDQTSHILPNNTIIPPAFSKCYYIISEQ